MKYQNFCLSTLFTVISVIFMADAQITVAPTWSPCNQIKVGTYILIDYPTTGSTLPDIFLNITYTFPWPYPNVPRVAAALTKFHSMTSLTGIDFFFYQISYVSTHDFQAQLWVGQPLYYLQFRYVVVDTAFPYHFNVISNLNILNSVNYAATTTTNVVINYSAKTSGCLYTQFTNPYSNYKILFYLTCISYSGSVETSTLYPPSLNVTAVPTSLSQFTITIKVGTIAVVSYLHGTFVVFDQVQITNSKQFYVKFDSFLFKSLGGGEIEIPQQYQGYTLMGLTDFDASSTKNYIDFQLNFGPLPSNSSSYGITFSPASAQPTNYPTNQPADFYRFTTMYMQQLLCPNSSFYLDLSSTPPICISCQIIANCLVCLNGTYCQNCMNGYALVTISVGNVGCNKIVCTDIHCNLYSSPSICTQCDFANNYFLLPNSTCGFCDSSLNFFINMSDPNYPCIHCSPSNCQICSSLTQCSVCSTSPNNYIVNVYDDQCYLCSSVITNCQICQTYSQCQSCLSPYVLNATDVTNTGQCIPCPLVGCLQCINITNCLQCDSNNSYGITINQICEFCNASLQYFVNFTSLQCQLCKIDNCLQCSSLIHCQMCNISDNYYNDSNGKCLYCNNSQNYFINVNTSFTCDLCSLQQCVICQSLQQCNLCNISNNFVLNSSTLLCELCNIQNCVQCLDQNNCKVCNQSLGYYVNYNNGKCQTKINENQKYSVERQKCNGFKIILQNENNDININNILILNKGIQIINIQQNEQTIVIHSTYDHSLVNQNILLRISPTSSSLLSLQPSSLIPLLYYSENQCQNQQNIQSLVAYLQYISYAVLFVSLFAGKIVGLQLFGVLQIAYFSLASHNYFNIYLSKLVNFRIFNGFNLNNVANNNNNNNIEFPQIYTFIGTFQNFINNCNIMLILFFAELLISAILYAFSALIHSIKLQSFSIHLLKQGFITFVIFNCFNVSFSAAVHWKYYNNDNINSNLYTLLINVLIIVTLLAILISIIIMELMKQDQYGEFKNKFKNIFICKLFIPLTVLYRVLLGIIIALQCQYDYTTLFTFGISLFFMLYILINLPFDETYQNYRTAVIHFTTMYILLAANYYKTMKSNTQMQIKGYIFMPTIILYALIVLCVIVSIISLLYEIYKWIHQYRKQYNKNHRIKDIYKQTENSFAGLG